MSMMKPERKALSSICEHSLGLPVAVLLEGEKKAESGLIHSAERW